MNTGKMIRIVCSVRLVRKEDKGRDAYLDHEPVHERHLSNGLGLRLDPKTISPHKDAIIPVCGRDMELVGEPVPVEQPGQGINVPLGSVQWRRVLQPYGYVSRQNAPRICGSELVDQHRLRHNFPPSGRFKEICRRTHVVPYKTPQRDVVLDLLIAQVDSLTGQAQPNHCAAEGVDRGKRVQVVDGETKFFDVVVAWVILHEAHDPAPNGGVQQSHSHGGYLSLATGVHAVCQTVDLKRVLGCLQQSTSHDVRAEPASAG